MVQINGKYKLVENKNFYEFLLAVGVPEAKAKEDSEIKGAVEVTVDGDKITMANTTPEYVTNLVAGKEVEEKMGEFTLLSTTKLEGNVITITCKTQEGKPAGTRVMTFTDGGIEVVVTADKDGQTHKTTRIYKRI